MEKTNGKLPPEASAMLKTQSFIANGEDDIRGPGIGYPVKFRLGSRMERASEEPEEKRLTLMQEELLERLIVAQQQSWHQDNPFPGISLSPSLKPGPVDAFTEPLESQLANTRAQSKNEKHNEKPVEIMKRKPGPNLHGNFIPRPSQRQVEVVIPVKKQVSFTDPVEEAPKVPDKPETVKEPVDKDKTLDTLGDPELTKIIEDALQAQRPVVSTNDEVEQQKQRTYQRISKIRAMLNENPEWRSLWKQFLPFEMLATNEAWQKDLLDLLKGRNVKVVTYRRTR
ncbi:hypothetical protein BDZ89DRAFT_1044247 [Hymenopellis radicata]|nr:hypothetical protein BDZ89DRAFT_1044247 [Hymenopellis radicata]